MVLCDVKQQLRLYFLILGFNQNHREKEQGTVVQSIVSLTSSLMTNSFTVVAKVFLNKLIILLQKYEQLLQCNISRWKF